ncbi:MAG: EscU/YscU/HrcU family type III secretion system export apparatus switch protein [Gammaproteobacteria bacterium]|nr:EscU/YscU/HrcU family type III secretion system export apparatus switch protein [Gammaproteobacteria bacterium]
MIDKEKPKKVVGLQYKHGEGLPKVIVKGSGSIAEQILKKRSLNSGPKVFKNKELVEQLYRLPMDSEISRDSFQLVAILLTHVFSIEEKLKQKNE